MSFLCLYSQLQRMAAPINFLQELKCKHKQFYTGLLQRIMLHTVLTDTWQTCFEPGHLVLFCANPTFLLCPVEGTDAWAVATSHDKNIIARVPKEVTYHRNDKQHAASFDVAFAWHANQEISYLCRTAKFHLRLSKHMWKECTTLGNSGGLARHALAYFSCIPTCCCQWMYSFSK